MLNSQHVSLHFLLRIHPGPSTRLEAHLLVVLLAVEIVGNPNRSANYCSIKPLSVNVMQVIADQPTLQHSPLIAVIKQRQTARRVVALAVIAAQRLIRNANTRSNLAQHVAHKAIELCIGPTWSKAVKSFTWEQSLECSRLTFDEAINFLEFVEITRVQRVQTLLHKTHDVCRRSSCRQFAFGVAAHIPQPADNHVHPRDASRLRPPGNQVQVLDVLCRNPAHGLSMNLTRIGKVPRVKAPHPIGDGTLPLINFNAKTYRVAGLPHVCAHAMVQKQIRFNHLQGKRNSTLTKRPAYFPDDGLTVLKHATDSHAQKLGHAKLPGSVAGIFFTPPLPSLFDLIVNRLIRRSIALCYLSLQANTGAHHIVNHNALQVCSVRIVPNHLPGPISKRCQARE